MKKNILLLSAFKLFSTCVFAQCASNANVHSFIHNNKTYELVKDLKTWSDAASCAVERGGYLVEINDSNEQKAVYNGILASGISTTYKSVPDGGGATYVWIGATDKKTEGTWLWDGNNDGIGINFWNGEGAAGADDGVPVGNNYNNWGKSAPGVIGEPDDFAGQDCGAIALTGWPVGNIGEWNDIQATNTLYYVIEKSNPNPPKADFKDFRISMKKDSILATNTSMGSITKHQWYVKTGTIIKNLDTGVGLNHDLRFRLNAINSFDSLCLEVTDAASQKSSSCKFLKLSTSEILNLDQQIPVSIFPNPNNGKFTLDIATDHLEDIQISIYNNQGKELAILNKKSFERKNNSILMNFSNSLKNGIYYIKISTPNTTIYRQIMIEN